MIAGCQTVLRSGPVLRNGQGTLTYPNGDVYVGNFVDGSPKGRGTHSFANGNKYTGEFGNGRPNGRGTLTYANGDAYVGKFVNGRPNGRGAITYRNGDKFVGIILEYFQASEGGPFLPVKQGFKTFDNGDKFTGEFMGNTRHGKGVHTYADGRVKEGVWDNDMFKYSQRSIPKVAATPNPYNPPKVIVTKPPAPKGAIKPRRKPAPSSKSGSTGSGFFVSKLGHIVTNQHVVKSCINITVGDNSNSQVQATVIESDRRNDLALLKISSTEMASEETKSLIRKLDSPLARNLGLKVVPLSSNGLLRSDDVELGESLLVAGYPYGDIFSNTIKVTKGIVSAIRGIGDDSGQFQLDAAVQPGNSGGPIYDENGNIVGVVVAQLNKLKMAKTIGSMPENVNFGIKASTVRSFLTSSGLPTKWSSRSKSMPTKDLAKIAKNQTVMVVCHR
jgi:S1-C subfamily serine protease